MVPYSSNHVNLCINARVPPFCTSYVPAPSPALHVEVGLGVPDDFRGRARVAVGDGRHQGRAQPLAVVRVYLGLEVE